MKEKIVHKPFERKTGLSVTLESIQLLPNLRHEYYHEYVERLINEGIICRKCLAKKGK
jgi:hypothetical protein